MIVGYAGCGSMPEALMVALIGKCPCSWPADIAYSCAFGCFVDGGISHPHRVPVVGRDGSILFCADFAGVGAGFIAVAVKLAFVVKQLHRPAARSFGQYDGQPDKAGGICKPRHASKPGSLIGIGQRHFGPVGERRLTFSFAGHAAEIARHRDGIIHIIPVELD